MDDEYAIKTLKRVHDSAVTADPEAANGVVEQFNEALEILKENFPDNEPIQNIEQVDRTTRMQHWPSRLEKVKLRTEQIADALDLGEGFEAASQREEMPLVVVEQSTEQSVEQDVSQEVSVESVMELIELDPQASGNEETLRELVEAFESELSSDDPDPGSLRQFVEDAKEYSTSVAAKLAMMGLEAGVVDILDLQ